MTAPDSLAPVEEPVSVADRVRAGLAYPFEPAPTAPPVEDAGSEGAVAQETIEELQRAISEAASRANEPHEAKSGDGPTDEDRRLVQAVKERMARDLSPSNITLAIGSTWTGHDGTVYDVVAPGDVGDRPRWWIAAHLVDGLWAGPHSPDSLHCGYTGAPGSAFALVLRIHRDVKPDNVAPASEVDTLRARVGELESEVERLNHELVEARLYGGQDRDAFKAIAGAIECHLPPVADLLESVDWLTRIANAGTEIEALRLSLGEARSQLASAHAACEASRKAREEAVKEVDSVRSALERDCNATVVAGITTGKGLPLIEHVTRLQARLSLDHDEKCSVVVRNLQLAREDRRILDDRIASLVASHIVRTTGPEPALEGLGRIELALVEGGKAKEEVKRLKARKRKAKVQPVRTSRPRRVKALRPALVADTRWRHRITGRFAIIRYATDNMGRPDFHPGYAGAAVEVVYRYEKPLHPTGDRKPHVQAVRTSAGRFLTDFQPKPARKPKPAKRKAGR
jgi:hypothetical protein